MSIILIIVGFILLILGFLGLGVLPKLKWSKVLFRMPQWHAAVELVLGIVVIVIGFMSL
ncbi:MAG: hypothetical protein ACQEP5_00850 [Actinomycetota bacterium]